MPQLDRPAHRALASLGVVLFLGGGCAATQEGVTLDGDSAVDSHDDGPADYDTVFRQGVVQRLDIAIAAEDYEAMTANLDEIVQDGGHSPPPMEALQACQGLVEGDPCQYGFQAETVTRTCEEGPNGGLACVEQGGGQGGELVSDDPMWVPVTVTYEGLTWTHVGLRYKGNSSLSHSWQQGVLKLPFRMDFDQYEDTWPETEDQRFYGFKKLTFAPGFHDDSYLRDTLVAELMGDFGIVAARTAFYEVHVDAGDGPVYWGLFVAIEDPSDVMMEAVFRDDSGNLYKPEGSCADWTCFDEESFVRKSNEDETDYSDIQAALDALHAEQDDAESWRAGLEATVDVETFLSWLALKTAIENWDAYGQAPHNYYLYADPLDDDRLVWIPWDHNLALNTGAHVTLSPLLDEVGERWPLIRYLLDDPEYAALYREELVRALELESFQVDPFTARAEELHDLVRPFVEAEQAPYTQLESISAFDGSVPDLVEHVLVRRETVEDALGGQ